MSRWWVRAAVSVAVAAIMLTFVPVGRVWSAIVEVNPWVWAASTGIFVGGHSMNSLKQRRCSFLFQGAVSGLYPWMIDLARGLRPSR